MRIFILSLSLVLALVQCEDYSCPKGKSRVKRIVLSPGDSVSYNTNYENGATYYPKTKCPVQFKAHKKCKDGIKFSCSGFDLPNRSGEAKKCKKGDKLILGRTAYCGSEGPDDVTLTGKAARKGLKVLFVSDKKTQGDGAQCTAQCLDGAATTEAPTTTSGSSTASSAAPASSTGSPVACVDCTTEAGTQCQFPFITNGQTFTSCTQSGDTRAWCSTKVDSNGNHISGIGEWGYCTAACPDDSGYPASGSGPACQVRTTGQGYPDQCSDQLNKSNKNILFIGNSYTYGNDLPGMVKNLAAAAGKSATTTMVAPGGQTLAGHVSGGIENTIRNGNFDVVVIQDQSQRPSFGQSYVYGAIMPDVEKISRAIQETNPCTMPVYFMTWGKRDGDSQNCGNHETFCSFDGVQNMLTPAYLSMAYASQPASVAPAGEAWRVYSDRNSLFAGDGSHASSSGTYLTALTMLETIWPGVSGVGSSYAPVSDARALQDIAHMTMLTRNWSYPEDGDHPCSTMAQYGGAPCLG